MAPQKLFDFQLVPLFCIISAGPLFDEDEEDDLFSVPKSDTKIPEKKSSLLVDDDMFSPPKPIVNKPVAKETMEEGTDDQKHDLFSTNKPDPVPPKPKGIPFIYIILLKAPCMSREDSQWIYMVWL